MRRKNVDMLSGSITKSLLAISIPVMVMNVVQSLFNIIDMTILKTYDGNGMAVGAVGVCGSLISLITGLVIGISAGANVVVAKHIGRKDQNCIDRAVGTAMAFSVLAGVALAVIGISCAELFLGWMNCPDRLIDQAALYFRLYFAGVPILMVYNFCASILRASGDTRRPMFFLTLGGVIKVVCTYWFVSQYQMGVEGVAFATILSWSMSAFLGLHALTRNTDRVRIRIRNIRFYWSELSPILRIGVPAGLQQALYSIANVIIVATVNSFGPEATTGISIANNYDGILYQLCHATSLAVMPYVSQNIGAGNVKRAMQSVWKGILITVCLGVSFGALSAVFSAQLSSIMSSDPVVINYSCQKMVIISSTYFICGINDVFGAALRGMGKPIIPTVATMLFLCALRFVWVYWIFPLVPNMTFLYLVWPVGWTLSIIMLLFVFFPTARKLAKPAQPSPNATL